MQIGPPQIAGLVFTFAAFIFEPSLARISQHRININSVAEKLSEELSDIQKPDESAMYQSSSASNRVSSPFEAAATEETVLKMATFRSGPETSENDESYSITSTMAAEMTVSPKSRKDVFCSHCKKLLSHTSRFVGTAMVDTSATEGIKNSYPKADAKVNKKYLSQLYPCMRRCSPF